eukprot:16034546-Heterocapsa_arctica.AAC.1
MLQQEFGSEGVIPASVYYLAIQGNDPSALGFDPKPNEPEPADVSVRRRQRDGDRKIISGDIGPPMGIDAAAD